MTGFSPSIVVEKPVHPQIDDPQDCPDCCAIADICPYHQGVAAGWHSLAVTVGLLVVEARSCGG